VGVATGVESLELKDGEGGRGAILGVGNKTSGFGVVRLRIVGGAGNKANGNVASLSVVSSLEYSESESEVSSGGYVKYGVDPEAPV
jgi:hypothetical protein